MNDRGTSLLEFVVSGSIITLALGMSLRVCHSHPISPVSEVKANLKALYTSQRAYFAEKDTFSTSVAEIGFQPERGNRYSYFNGGAHLVDRSGATETIDGTHTGYLVDTLKHPTLRPLMPTLRNLAKVTAPAEETACAALPVGCIAPGAHGSFMAVAVGHSEKAPDLDNWLISSMILEISASADSEAQTAAPGQPTNNVNGVR